MNDHELAIIARINDARAARGIAPLKPDNRLSGAARGHAEDMAAHPGMVHIGSDGSTIGERILRSGYRGAYYAELVGYGFEGEPGPMVDWWLQSPDHAPYILDPAMTDIGAGYATGLGPWGSYWTVDMGAGDSAAATFWSYAPVAMGGG